MIDFSTQLTDFSGNPIQERELNGEVLLSLLREVLGGNEAAVEAAKKTVQEVPPPEPLTLRRVCADVLKAQFKDEQNLSGEKKVERGLLAQYICLATGPIELESDDITLLKGLIAKGHGPLVVTRAWGLLDPASLKLRGRRPPQAPNPTNQD